jgi:peroxiredoxin/DNA-binding transcriptional MerR regulator
MFVDRRCPMRISKVARQTGVSVKAIRYYEQLGLVVPTRESNGYRSFGDDHVRAVAEIRDLARIGIPPGKARPFVECLDLGHDHGDDCVDSLVVYRDTIADLDQMIDALSSRRETLRQRLHHRAGRTFTAENTTTEKTMTDFTMLPDGLPVPEDDGRSDHLPGSPMPRIVLPTSDGGTVDTAGPGPARTVIYCYPLSGRPGVDLPRGWDEIPGARGCSTEACDFRDHFQELRDAGVGQVYGLSSQSPDYEAELVERLRLPFTMISDEAFTLADALDMPTFSAPGHSRLYARLTLIVHEGTIEHVFYPVFPPNEHARQVLTWLRGHPA